MTETLLIVDDQEDARAAFSTLLKMDGYRLECVSSGAEALQRLDAMPIDLVLCDAMMPGMDGFAVCEAIKAHPEWRYVPTVLVTALDGQDDMVRALAAGADDFLSKPLDRVLLRARVRALLRIRRQYRDARSPEDLETVLKARRERQVAHARLTAREREVLDLLLLGRTHSEIGLALGIAARTAAYHQANILEKLGADSRLDLLRLFVA
jgi:DNA-binding NarL/FixJ family response regulator